MASSGDLFDLYSLLRSRDGTGPKPRSSAPAECLQASRRTQDGERRIRETIEAQIIPSLLLSHTWPSRQERRGRRDVGPDDVAELARIVVAHDPKTTRVFLEALRGEGVRTEAILVDLVAPAARLLGDLWATDRCSFAEVTIGLCVLQRMTSELGRELEDHEASRRLCGRALLAPVPGEQHTLGLQMVADCMRRHGWDVTQLALATTDEIVSSLKSGFFDLLGLSISNDGLVPQARTLVERVRSTSENPHLKVMVGGACFRNPDLSRVVRADFSALDGEAVVHYLHQHFERVGAPSVR